MADKRCENGHYIDESWDLCPYCPPPSNQEIAVVRPDSSEPVPMRPPAPAGPRRVRPAEIPPAQAAERGAAEADAPGERTVVVRPSAEGETKRRYVVAWLVGLSGSTRGESYPVRMGRNVLGRDRRADVVIPDDQASTHHADLVFRPEEGRFILMDHNSTNGTYVNEAEIEPRRDLTKRDVIRIGTHRFLFVPLCSEGRMWDGEGELA